MNSRDFKVREIPSGKGHYYISNDDVIFVLKNGNISTVFFHCYWESKKEAEIFLAGWQALQQINTSKVDKEQHYPLGMLHTDVFGQTWIYFHKVKPKPYQFKPGDVVEFLDGDDKRIIIADAKGLLHAVSLEGEHTSVAHKHNLNFIDCHYKKIGELKDYIK